MKDPGEKQIIEKELGQNVGGVFWPLAAQEKLGPSASMMQHRIEAYAIDDMIELHEPFARRVSHVHREVPIETMRVVHWCTMFNRVHSYTRLFAVECRFGRVALAATGLSVRFLMKFQRHTDTQCVYADQQHTHTGQVMPPICLCP